MRRKNSLRLPYYDYRSGWFFVTVITHRRRDLLGRIEQGSLLPSALGDHALEAWSCTQEHRSTLEVPAFQLMPDHLHGVLGLDGRSGTLGNIVGSFKSRATRLARAAGTLEPSEKLWQRGYNARWLPDDAAVQRAVAYARNNPSKWWATHAAHPDEARVGSGEAWARR